MQARWTTLVCTLLLAVSSDAIAQSGLKFYPLSPCRVIDTRFAPWTPALTNNEWRPLPIKGYCGVPTAAQAAAFNLTIVSPTQAGHLTVWPYGINPPLVSTLNYLAGDTAIANGAVIQLASHPTYHIYVQGAVQFGTGTVDLVVDVTGYYGP